MKITKERLMEIITEEINNGQEEQSAIDIKLVKKSLPKINTTNEYKELVELIIAWGENIPQKKTILTALLRALPEVIQGM